ncbi:MAG: MBOAT family protein, partial [Muribaculaceae bacterium]|nr:MBOAT family protein [Muribaculaceae bacterium]
MIFNSLSFLIFFPIVVLLYWILPHKWRNPMLLVASYYFYMNWEPVYALLIFLSTLTTWGAGRLIERVGARRRLNTGLCIALNLAILFTFKYLRFIGDQLQLALDSLGIGMQVPTFDLLLPVGISFYTFQALGYIIDVYKRDITAERSLMTYALFVAFFPQLVAGPIERAKSLLPPFHIRHKLSNELLLSGLRLMLWGYFRKVCVADNLA